MNSSELKKAVRKVLVDLIRIPSVNPRAEGGRGTAFKEKKIAGYVARFLKKKGIPVRLEEALPGRPNVFARIGPSVRPRRRILIEAHLDTVEVEGMKIPPFSAEFRKGRIFGRGAVDCKGPLAAMLCAFAILDRKKIRSQISFCAAVGEEHDMLGAKCLMKKRRGFDWAIVGEPTSLKITVAHNGVIRWDLTVFGLPAHGARPELGVNAVYKMSDFIQALNRDFAGKKRKRHPFLGGLVYNLGKISGGITYNIVPERCTIMLERRFHPGESKEGATRELKEFLAALKKKDPQFVYQLKVAGSYFSMEISPRHDLVLSLKESIEKFHPGVMLEGKRGATDAGLYSQYGIPSVVFGPGDSNLSHSAGENIKLDEVIKAVFILKDFLENN